MQMKQKAPSRNNCSFPLKCKFTKYKIKLVCLNESSSLIVQSFSNKKLKKLYPDLKFTSHFIRNTSDLKLKTLFLICGTRLYLRADFLLKPSFFVNKPSLSRVSL